VYEWESPQPRFYNLVAASVQSYTFQGQRLSTTLITADAGSPGQSDPQVVGTDVVERLDARTAVLGRRDQATRPWLIDSVSRQVFGDGDQPIGPPVSKCAVYGNAKLLFLRNGGISSVEGVGFIASVSPVLGDVTCLARDTNSNLIVTTNETGTARIHQLTPTGQNPVLETALTTRADSFTIGRSRNRFILARPPGQVVGTVSLIGPPAAVAPARSAASPAVAPVPDSCC
jgi:hypothetical protein